MTQKVINHWNSLNSRQQTYLKAIYTADQEAEKAENRWCTRARLPKRPASEWRWLLYADLAFGHTRLKELLIEAQVVDKGTGSTFEALRVRNLILCRYERAGINPIVIVRLTTHGRKVARAGLGETAPKKLPPGTLREWHWKALATVYNSDKDYCDDECCGNYYGISWNTWLRLRDYKAGALVEERQDNIYITEQGKRFYHDNWAKYKQMYPDIDAIEPKFYK